MMANRYWGQVTYLPVREIERTTVQLLGFMLLARVDGKSPVEYITAEEEKQRVRDLGMAVLKSGMETLDQVIQAV